MIFDLSGATRFTSRIQCMRTTISDTTDRDAPLDVIILTLHYSHNISSPGLSTASIVFQRSFAAFPLVPCAPFSHHAYSHRIPGNENIRSSTSFVLSISSTSCMYISVGIHIVVRHSPKQKDSPLNEVMFIGAREVHG